METISSLIIELTSLVRSSHVRDADTQQVSACTSTQEWHHRWHVH